MAMLTAQFKLKGATKKMLAAITDKDSRKYLTRAFAEAQYLSTLRKPKTKQEEVTKDPITGLIE